MQSTKFLLQWIQIYQSYQKHKFHADKRSLVLHKEITEFSYDIEQFRKVDNSWSSNLLPIPDFELTQNKTNDLHIEAFWILQFSLLFCHEIRHEKLTKYIILLFGPFEGC